MENIQSSFQTLAQLRNFRTYLTGLLLLRD